MRLLRGKKPGIDASVIRANASLRALGIGNTEEQYWDMSNAWPLSRA